jgi:hypothetical protein
MIVSRALFLYFENFQRRALGPALRTIGQRMIKNGFKIQGEYSIEDKCKTY